MNKEQRFLNEVAEFFKLEGISNIKSLEKLMEIQKKYPKFYDNFNFEEPLESVHKMEFKNITDKFIITMCRFGGIRRMQKDIFDSTEKRKEEILKKIKDYEKRINEL